MYNCYGHAFLDKHTRFQKHILQRFLMVCHIQTQITEMENETIIGNHSERNSAIFSALEIIVSWMLHFRIHCSKKKKINNLLGNINWSLDVSWITHWKQGNGNHRIMRILEINGLTAFFRCPALSVFQNWTLWVQKFRTVHILSVCCQSTVCGL